MTKDEMIVELEATIREVGSAKDHANRGEAAKAMVVMKAMELLAALKGYDMPEYVDIDNDFS